MESIVEKVSEVFRNVLLEEDDMQVIDSNQPLINYGLNSINFIQAVVNLEKEFGIEIEDEFLLRKDTVSILDMEQYIISCK